jgi:hypothetical protein
MASTDDAKIDSGTMGETNGNPQDGAIDKISQLKPPVAENREVRIIRASVDIYEVLESDLDKFIEQGSGTGTSLTLWTSCASVCCTVVITLATANLPPYQTEIWVGVATGTGIIAIASFLHWLRSKNSLKETIKRIKSKCRPQD